MLGLTLTPGHINDGPCWVCGTMQSLEFHHIIPCAYGGTDGPQISLCAIDHALVHKLSYQLGDGVPELIVQDDRLRALPIKKARRAVQMAMYLAQVIKSSRELTSEDPNKKVKFHTSFTKDTSDKLKQLMVFYGFRNQEQALVQAIEDAHARYLSTL